MIIVLPNKIEVVGDHLFDAAVDASTYTQSAPGAHGRYGSIKHTLFNGASLPIGLLDRFLKTLRASGTPFDVIDTRPPIDPDELASLPDGFGDITLRDYQIEALMGLLSHHVGVLKASTGSGKSVVLCAMVLLVPGPWLVLVHRQNLLESLMDTYLRMGGRRETMGCVQAGKFKVGDVTFAMSTSLAKHPQADVLLSNVKAVVVDECHSVGGTGYQHLLERCVNADRRYGLSATPYERSDGTGLLVEAQLGPQRVHISTERLLQEGRVAEFKVYSVIYEHPSSEAIRTPYGYTVAYKEAITGNAERDMVAIECIRRAAMPGFVFVKHQDHAIILEEKIRKFTGLNTRCVTGSKVSAGLRTSVLKDLAIGKIDVVIATKVFYEGADVQNTASVIDLAGGNSVIEVVQKAGRGSRRPEGKETCEIWVIQDEGWSAFSTQSRRRVATLRDEGHTVNVCKFVGNELEIIQVLPPKKRKQKASAAGQV